MSNKPTISKRENRGNTARPMSDLLGKILEPVMARRSGMTLDLLNAWGSIVGKEFSAHTKPERINWPRRAHEDDPFEPATLVVACEGAVALFFQHEQAAILERINLFFGFEAIKRMKIEQKPVGQPEKQPVVAIKALSTADEAQLSDMLSDIDNQTLKETLMKLGRGVISQAR